jgi:hypothetical protein
LIPAIAKILEVFESEIKNQVQFTQERLTDFEAIIATGSNNTARYFEYYFGKYPNIIRKNRNGVGVLTGNESTKDLELLGKDIFSYFGLGCRNVSKLFLPENYDLELLFKAFEKYADVASHYKYANNYDFNKSIYLVNKEDHLDNGFLLLKNSPKINSPISVVYFEKYKDLNAVKQVLKDFEDEIQCVVAKPGLIENQIEFGKSQQPELWDYADGIDTLDFLLSLSNLS